MTHKEMVKQVRILLKAHANSAEAYLEIAPLVASKSVEMNHLYEDIGFPSRQVMSEFMQRHFPSLAAKKPGDVRWKKYLYDCIGTIAPACHGCMDMDNCFNCECGVHLKRSEA